ncbi:sensor histidine kinase [Inmirania thermothiophila]|uniref:histidine kinase n=1 Tax=Inmirania thermothiophila TaxID=1750597 RepID=A0A3N1XZI1_9GAMM|nr:HAMP domain-containing sensor histidine kinase [Inmirania thermothiophila]ROR31979.1 signal transduction histidine kinase [Inmirania thermothiophila]
MTLRDLSLRYKVPLRTTVLILVTALVVTSALLVRAAQDLRADLTATATATGRLLARTLTPALLHDDVWKAYEIIASALPEAHARGGLRPDLLMILDPMARVYVSTEPRRFPMQSDPGEDGPEYAAVRDLVAAARTGTEQTFTPPSGQGFHVTVPIVSDGVLLGTLVMSYPREIFRQRILGFGGRAVAATLLAVVFLLPLGAYWGAQYAEPLVRLARAMRAVGREVPERVELELPAAGDEIGQLAVQFERMVAELREKQRLEQQMVVAERLAAIGRFTAGIAHEINNPLGGLLNAVSTLRRHGCDDPLTQRTVSLLERGLHQIRETVAALLVEARPDPHPLTREDIEDVRRLVAPEAGRRGITLAWDNRIPERTRLPASLVRQVLINLLLNAVQAAPEGGRVGVRASIEGGLVRLEVCNDGPPIPAEALPRLFEPFATTKAGGRGLGLWVTYQIVDGLGGEIQVTSEAGDTRFRVTLPLDREDAPGHPPDREIGVLP